MQGKVLVNKFQSAVKATNKPSCSKFLLLAYFDFANQPESKLTKIHPWIWFCDAPGSKLKKL